LTWPSRVFNGNGNGHTQRRGDSGVNSPPENQQFDLSANNPTEEAYESLRRLQKYSPWALSGHAGHLSDYAPVAGKITEPLTQFHPAR
jgi:hypothetical protein